MAIFIWEDRFLIGVKEIDEHHRHLVALLNGTYDNFLHHAPPGELDRLFDELVDYATYHFAAEEQRMEERLYPHRAAHKRQHDEFIRRLVEMHADHQKRKALPLEALVFLQEWLADHILKVDAELGRFLAAAVKPTRKGGYIDV